MAGTTHFICPLCKRHVPANARILKCDCCSQYVHKNCSNLTKNNIDEIVTMSRHWSCLNCNDMNFPFNNIIEEREFLLSLPAFMNDYLYNRISNHDVFNPFDSNDELFPLEDANPDTNYFNQNICVSDFNSNYYLEHDLKKIFRTQGDESNCLSFIHLNI